MTRRAIAAAALLLAGACAQPRTATPAAAPASPGVGAQAPEYAAAIAAARALVRDSMRAGHIPGLTVAVARDGRIVWSEGFGSADLENGVPVTTATKFRIGSVSKSLTAAGMALLVEEGKLDLDAPIQRYVPSFPRKRWPITARELAGHLAGIRHYLDDESLGMKHYPNVVAGLAIFENDTLLFEPGTHYSYSSYGFNLLSAVMEGAAGQPYLTYMQRRVFGPLALRNTTAEYPDSLIAHRGRYYDHDSAGTLLNAPYVDNSYKWAGGGFISTAEDLVTFGSALQHPGFLQARSLAMLFTSQRTRDGVPTGYGMGWSIDTLARGDTVLHHGGSSVGANAHLAIFPRSHLVIAAICNTTSHFVGAGTITRQLAALFAR